MVTYYWSICILVAAFSTTLFPNNSGELINVQKYVNMKITLFHVIIPTHILSLNKKTDLLREHLVESEIEDGSSIEVNDLLITLIKYVQGLEIIANLELLKKLPISRY